MSQRMLRRIVTVGALAALLALAMPGQAEARELGGWSGMLRWLNGFWGSGASALWSSTPAEGESSVDRRPTTKQGLGIDPNGKPIPDPVAPNGATCGAACDQGYGIDPNG